MNEFYYVLLKAWWMQNVENSNQFMQCQHVKWRSVVSSEAIPIFSNKGYNWQEKGLNGKQRTNIRDEKSAKSAVAVGTHN